MKKFLFVIALLFVLSITPNIKASNKTVETQKGSPSPRGGVIQSLNEVKTQNNGEGSQLQVTTQEVEQLLNMSGKNEDTENQIREIVQEQIKAQEQIRTELKKIETRSNLTKRLFGSDYNAIKSLNQQLIKNKLRIEELTRLQNQVTNQADSTMLEEAIQTLIEQNTSLEAQINSEQQTKSIFGWLLKLFSN